MSLELKAELKRWPSDVDVLLLTDAFLSKCIKICVQLETEHLVLILRRTQIVSFANADSAQL